MKLRMKLHPVSLAILTLLAGINATHAAQAAADTRRPYIVQLADKPVASYTGGVSGIAATRPQAGQRLNLASGDAQAYASYLDGKQASVRALVAGAPIGYEYKVVLNGFSAMLTDAEVRKLKASSAVASVAYDQERHVDTNYTPIFLGLDGPGGLWSQLGGKGAAGENVVVGIVDTGIWPENPAYADRVDSNGVPTFDAGASLAYSAPPAAWKGICQTGEGFTADNCNNKLIGAQYFNAGFKASGNTIHWSDFVSPRDSLGEPSGEGGHGTHTSSTAAGNNGVPATVGGANIGGVSGMAPRARVAMYKVCWTYNAPAEATGGKNSCFNSDSVAAIEQATKDGVNVINYSISGGETVSDPVEQAFLHASNAGVFVAASGGNSGPTSVPQAAVAHISPWLATVAASTHDRVMQATLTLGNGATYRGASLNTKVLPSSPLIRAEDAGVAGADLTKLRLCYALGDNDGVAVLDPAKVAGKIVTCTRGVTARVAKSLAVFEAGGVGMVEIDNGAGLVSEAHSVPTVHISAADGAAVDSYAAKPGATASIGIFSIGKGAPGTAPVVAGFSSRGPNEFDPNLLKPDVSAPGVDILAGYAPALTEAERAAVVNGTLVPPPAWQSLQGTSMASPHVAGVAALLHQAHPSWSPAAIKSALMTTAIATLPDTQAGELRGILPWGQGAGNIAPTKATDPGLVYDLTQADYKKYMCGAGITTECGTGTIAGYNLNLPSITLSNVNGVQVVTRTVTNVGSTAATYTASGSVSGYTLAVAPTSLTLEPGQSKSYTVTLTRSTAADNVWQFGSLVWSDGVHSVRSPVQARSGQKITAPALLSSDRVSGVRLVGVATGFAGYMGAAKGGLKAVTRTPLTIAAAEDGTVDSLAQVEAACNAGATGTKVLPFTFPSATIGARFETFEADTAGTWQDDIDLAVLKNGVLIAYSGHGGSNENITLASPAAGSYQLCVIGYALANPVANAMTLSSVIVSRADVSSNLVVSTPARVYTGGTASVGVSWSGLAKNQRYLGGLQLLDQAGATATTTLLSVDTTDAIPLAEPASRVSKLAAGK